MKIIRLWLLVSLVFILSISTVFVAVSTGVQYPDKENKIGISQFYSSSVKMVSNITLILNYHDGENATFHNLVLVGDISPYNATIVAIGDENITRYFATNRVFVISMRINGLWYTNGDQMRNWLYYVDGTFPGVSSSVLQLNNNSIIEWRFVGGNPFNNNPGSDDTFWIYIIVIIGIIAAITIGLILIAKKGLISFKQTEKGEINA